MICRCTARASALHSSLNRTLFFRHVPLSHSVPGAHAFLETGRSISPLTTISSVPRHQRSSSCQSPNSGKSSCLEVARRGGGGFEGGFHHLSGYSGSSRERSRIEPQFGAAKSTGAVNFRMRRAVSSGPGAEADDTRETSLSSPEVSGSHGYLVGGRYCVLLTGHASDYSQKLYGGYGQMFIKLLGDPGETWDIYAVVDGQFPAEEDLEKYDGFVVTGSRHDAHGSEDWIAKLCTLLQSLHEKKQNTLGVCFGHQVLSRALGGKTGKSDAGWEIGLRKVQTTDALATKPYAAGFPVTFRVLEVHQDQVQEVPPGGELLGYSNKTGIEIFAVGDHALGIQGHPEFTNDVVTDLIDSRLATGILKDEEAKDARATLMAGQADQEVLVRLCKGFIKRRS